MRTYLEVPDDVMARVDLLVESDVASGVDPSPTRASMLRVLIKRGLTETERKRGKVAHEVK